MWGRAFIPGVDDLHGASSVTEIQVSTPFVAIENKAPADRAHNLQRRKMAAVEQERDHIPSAGSSTCSLLSQYCFSFCRVAY